MSDPSLAADWRAFIPERRRRLLSAWFLGGALLTFLILIVGGATRLTESGLSIVEWRPISGVIPPIGEEAWQAAFEQYQQFPEYRQLRHGMTLDQFRVIFLWEYTHRLLARLIGLVFLVPALWFAWRGYLSRPLRRRVLFLFALGGMQGFVGWFMVSSGLVQNPHVSHYRLALHLFIALTVLGSCLWFAGELRTHRVARARPHGRVAVYWIGALLLLQILYGAFVAGLDAGLYFNTFPAMGGRLVPDGLISMEPPLLNFVANPIAVQWVHRALGTVLLIAALGIAGASLRTGDGAARYAVTFAALVAAQYALGIVTLLRFVPVGLGVLHQALAAGIFALWLGWLRVVRGAPRPGAAASAPPELPAWRMDRGADRSVPARRA